MSLLYLSLAFAWHHRVATLCTSISVALAIAVVLLVLNVREDVEHDQSRTAVAESRQAELVIKEGLLAYGSVLLLLSSGMILATLSLTSLIRRRDQAILRALGARPREVFLVVIGEAVLQITLGTLVGIVVSRIALTLMEASRLSASALFDRLMHIHTMEGAAVLLAYLAGLVAALLPAWQAYRMEVASGLKR